MDGMTARTARLGATGANTVAGSAEQNGLTDDQARSARDEFGPNTIPETSNSAVWSALAKFWAPVPWMLEAAIVLEMVLGKYIEGSIIGGLLVFNAALGLVQEGRAHSMLAALKSRLALTASVRRDGRWHTLPSSDLVPGDVVKLSLGGVVPADVRLISGAILVDQSMLTGESVPIEAGAGLPSYAGALVRRGEASAEVTATGARTKFGRTAELVRIAHVTSSQQHAVLRVVRDLAAVNGVAVIVLVACAAWLGLRWTAIVPLVLTAVLGSIPVALPATFTLASTIGARALAACGVLLTRLSAAEEAATMSVLCVDKTGTLTCNALTVATVRPMPGFGAAHVLAMAALASADGGSDPVDAAIRAAADKTTARLIKFIPFDPSTKMSEAMVVASDGTAQRVVKGALSVVTGLAAPSPIATKAAEALEEQGFRVLAVAAGPTTAMTLIGVLALSDPPRADAAPLVAELRALGVQTLMVTGDAPKTAGTVARAVGLNGPVCPPGPMPSRHPDAYAVFAGVLPEDKYKLVKAYQADGRTVGMCGDGANDAPALRQAQIGIAVSTATDIAKSAAGMVLTEPGLGGVVAAVKQGRVIFQRVQSYTLNSIIKKTVSVLFLIVGLLMTGGAILTPLLIVITMIFGDFLAMALTTDNVSPSPAPNAWQIGRLTAAGVSIGFCLLAFCSGAIAVGTFELRLPLRALQTLAFVSLSFGSQSTIYAIRGRRHLWSSRPSVWLVASSAANIVIASTLAVCGIGMTPLAPGLLACVLVASVGLAFVLNVVKTLVFDGLKIA